MMTREQLMEVLRENFPYLGSEYGVKRIGLFGSYAKDKPTEASDVDIVVEFDRPIRDIQEALGRINTYTDEVMKNLQ